MKSLDRPRPEVLVIGGGATGTGIARDLAMRGADVLLAEAGDLSTGASGGNHGMLHSGARYAATAPEAARECATEGEVLKRNQGMLKLAASLGFRIEPHPEDDSIKKVSRML